MFKWFVVEPFFFKTTSQGAATTLHCLTRASDADGGAYFDNCKKGTFYEKTIPGAEKELWNATERLI